MSQSNRTGLQTFILTLALSLSFSKVHAENYLYDVGNYVSDIEASERFYTSVFDFEVVRRWSEMQVSTDGVEFQSIPHKGVYLKDPNGMHLEFIESDNSYNYREVQAPVNHFALRVDDLNEVYDLALKAGAKPAVPISFVRLGDFNVKTGFVFGPDGERIQLIEILSD